MYLVLETLLGRPPLCRASEEAPDPLCLYRVHISRHSRYGAPVGVSWPSSVYEVLLLVRYYTDRVSKATKRNDRSVHADK